MITEMFGPSLVEIVIVWNFVEKVSKITDEGMQCFKNTPNLKHLTIDFSRHFDRRAIFNLAQYLSNLWYLRLFSCPI